MIALLGGDPRVIEFLQNHLVANGDGVSTSSIAWFEFLCGPPKVRITDDEIAIAHRFIGGRIVPTDSSTASLGARLRNMRGRTKGSQADCWVAAAAILNEAELFIINTADFKPFEAFGLRLDR